jgi:uncharacterized protein YjiS (DUF1127 family)
MNTLTHATPSTTQGGAPGALQRIVSGLHWLRIAYAEQRRAARARAELAQLDARALRDLGLTRSEIDSLMAEASGAAARTRLRVHDDPAGWWPK